MRTLVVSDLHLGASGDRSTLADPGVLAALCDAVGAADRLVLLGDVVELREGPTPEAVRRVAPALARIAEALPAAAPLVLLVGNHDHELIAPWLLGRPRDEPLGVAATVPVESGGPLHAVVDALGGSERGSVAYPGAWLREDVWAHHGHYADRHTTVPMLERIGAGIMARLVREGPAGPRRTEDYEAALAPMYAWIDALANLGGSGARGDGGLSVGAWETLAGSGSGALSLRRRLRREGLRVAFRLGIGGLGRTAIGPLSPDLSGAALRRGPLRGMAEVASRLGVDTGAGGPVAGHVVFGHTHRAGPLTGDDPAEWRTPGGAALLNVGCWVREPTFEGTDPSRSPYRAGFAGWVDSDPAVAPELVNLLD